MQILVEQGGGGCNVLDQGRWKCEVTDKCIPFTEQCGGDCWQNIPKCADQCIPPIPAELNQASFYVCEINGVETCLSQTEKCNGRCDTGFEPCGNKCIPQDQLSDNYQNCNGYCIPKTRDCVGNIS